MEVLNNRKEQSAGHLFLPVNGKLTMKSGLGVEPVTSDRVILVQDAIKERVSQTGYPCVAAIQSYLKDDYQVGLYRGFGRGQMADELAADLLSFRDMQKKSQSPFLTFWAVYPDDSVDTESEFEEKLWHELSMTVACDRSGAPWDAHFSPDPADKNFCFSVGGDAFFVVGLNPESSRLARKFPFPALIFNLYEQFEQIDREGHYQSMVKANRKRDILFQGHLNPMVEQHGDKWESIQFSGKNNGPEWKCPFKRFKNLFTSNRQTK